MRQSTIARGLLLLGALVGCAAGLALALGLGVDDIPSWMITVGMYKLAFIAAGSLLVAGALLGRAARSRRTLPNDASVDQRPLSPGSWNAGDEARQEPERVDRDRPNYRA